MHELAVCQGIIEQVSSVARQHGARRVSAIKVQIGPLAGVEPQLLAQAFPIACAGTLAEAAELQMEMLPLTVRCRSCGAETEARPNRLVCGACGDWQTQVISGDEMLLASVELITETEPQQTEEEDRAHV